MTVTRLTGATFGNPSRSTIALDSLHQVRGGFENSWPAADIFVNCDCRDFCAMEKFWVCLDFKPIDYSPNQPEIGRSNEEWMRRALDSEV
jgi:hypothetical protein